MKNTTEGTRKARKNIVRDRRYRLGLADMMTLKITPKGTYW